MSIGRESITKSFLKFCVCTCLSACSSGDGGNNITDDNLLEPEMAYFSWPNDSTSEDSSNQVVSKILVSDLNSDSELESIFLSVIPHSTKKRKSILRITNAKEYKEILSFNLGNLDLLHDSLPFSYDINKDGSKELFFISYERDKLYSFGFKEKKINTLQGRWTLKLPQALPEDFDRHIHLIEHNNQKLIKIDNYGIYEEKKKKPKVISL